jgi:hypothetical protein
MQKENKIIKKHPSLYTIQEIVRISALLEVHAPETAEFGDTFSQFSLTYTYKDEREINSLKQFACRKRNKETVRSLFITYCDMWTHF